MQGSRGSGPDLHEGDCLKVMPQILWCINMSLRPFTSHLFNTGGENAQGRAKDRLVTGCGDTTEQHVLPCTLDPGNSHCTVPNTSVVSCSAAFACLLYYGVVWNTCSHEL